MNSQELKNVLVYAPFGILASVILFIGQVYEMGASQEVVTISSVVSIFALLLSTFLVMDPDIVGGTEQYRHEWERHSYRKVINVGLVAIASAVIMSLLCMMIYGNPGFH